MQQTNIVPPGFCTNITKPVAECGSGYILRLCVLKVYCQRLAIVQTENGSLLYMYYFGLCIVKVEIIES